MGWAAARYRAHGSARRLPASEVPLGDALGRTLAGPLVASMPLPGFDTAAMDGYAIRGAGPWAVAGQTLAGQPAGPGLAAASAREVATGAPVPPGAEAVIPYERAIRDGDLVRGEAGDSANIRRAGESANIRRAGEEARPGDTLVAGGVRITPQLLGLAAALGYDALPVVSRPRITALITGDEVTTSGLPAPGKVRDAIGPVLAGLALAAGGELAALSYLPDRDEELARALQAAQAEIILVAGSSSVGQADYLHGCLRDLGAQVIVGRVACKPGRTQSLWRLPDGRIVIGLPGNPFAAFAAFLTLAVPACAGFLGAPLTELQPIQTGLVKAHPERTRLVPVRYRSGRVEPMPHDGSAMLKGLVLAEALAVVPPAADRRACAGLLPLPA